MSSIIMIALAAASIQAADAADANGCRFVSEAETEVVVFDDASSTSDAGDLLTSVRLQPQKPSELVESPTKFVRYKYRESKAAPWRWVGKTRCADARTIRVS